MKILIIGNGSIGVEKNSNKFYIPKNTGDFLKKINEGAEVHYMDLSSNYAKNNNLLDFDLGANNIICSVFKNKKNPFSYIKLLLLLLKMDYVYLFYPGTFSRLVALMAYIWNKPFGLYVRGKYYNQDRLDKFLLKRARFILTISPSFVSDLIFFCRNTEIISPMIDVNLDDLNKNREIYKPKIWNFLFVGRVEERKGIHELIDVAKNLKKHKINFVLNIVGGGDLFDEISASLVDTNLSKEIVLHGLISDKQELKNMYNTADCFVFTSHDEGFPRVLYEAMASALPIFTTFVGGVAGLMKNLDNCIEIPVKNADKASEIILKYIGEEDILRTVSLNGLSTIKKIIESDLLSHDVLLLKYLKK
ncbi:glycosyltransferase [Olleya marilimosa]|uniref:glycosyltransferase n=1 Tax=Olleya marilimosa TaxID=272164 RepID=UPI0030ECFF22|tara:strand:+ start:73154 stop:74239 length:1086 start_codon:yes stop_codon:yes gene_type:complete